jgi:hypothetical protein
MMQDGEAPALELEHAIGYSSICGKICWHPNGRKFLYAAGASIVICDLVDPHDQVENGFSFCMKYTYGVDI